MYGKANTAIKHTSPPLGKLDGKTVLIVGGTAGVGQSIAHVCAAKGAKVTVVGRTFRDAGKPNITFIQCDLSLMAEATNLGKTVEPADIVIFTTGIVPTAKKVETSEKIEIDMAVSCLSRLVVLRELAPRLKAGTRIFVWGMPGNGTLFEHPEDLNADKGYVGDFGWVHMNTVGGNEAIVHHLAASEQYKNGKLAIFGMNPGMLPTEIRDVMHGGKNSCFGSYLECCIACCFGSPSLPDYAATIAALIFSPKLEEHSGSLWSQSAHPILPNKEFVPPGKATEWYGRMEALLKSKGF
jgi:NAD(P)-dependent dehydrogenase (short-subunit alcohol dehydrogenase family)